MKTKHFEKSLPEGYRQVFYLNAQSVKVGLIMNLIALVILALVMIVAFLPLILTGRFNGNTFIGDAQMITPMMIFCVAIFAYIVLHELVHGIAYKVLTGEKLTFGISWSCAFCGVPKIYVKRRISLIASAAPLVVFTVIFLALAVWFYFVDPWSYVLTAVLFGLHLGGCSGDIYIILLLLFKFRDPETLIRDTGPEQTFYIPQNGDQ